MDLKVKRIAWMISIGLSVISIVFMMTLSSFSTDNAFGLHQFSFIDVVFGSTKVIISQERHIIGFSFLNFLSLLFVILGLWSAILKLTVKEYQSSKVASYVTFGLLLAASLLIIFSVFFIVKIAPYDGIAYSLDYGIYLIFFVTLLSSLMFILEDVLKNKK